MIDKARTHYRKFIGATLASADLALNDAAIAKTAEMRALRVELRASYPDSLALSGYKVASQGDEDGIIAAIFDRVGGNRTFLEVGVEDGTECNSHFLLLQGWRGIWVEANPGSATTIRSGLGGDMFPGRFRLIETYARADNIVSLYRDACTLTAVDDLDFFSLDIDGNDLFLIEELLRSGARPTVVCVEYNGKFPPPVRIAVTHDEARGWDRDDYFGASLQAFFDLLRPGGYALVTCTLPGNNAFFVRQDCLSGLLPVDPMVAWQPLRLHLLPLPAGHLPTLKYLRDLLIVPARD